MTQTIKKNQKLRNNEYYNMQEIFDDLYRRSKEGEVFEDLMQYILMEENILLAYRNIKNNTGSHTAGVDGVTIDRFSRYTPDEVIRLVKESVQGYKAQSVRRVEIPKPGSDKTRPLGIPTMRDRLIQQCFKQIMEPIAEAKFYNHSYGFRPFRSVEHADARCKFLMNQGHFEYCIEFDIESFFDNVNHTKLIKQIYTMGFQDPWLRTCIKSMLTAPIKLPDNTYIKPSSGTPQGGILSPLLSNICLNELDWWVSNNWENFKTERKYSSKDSRINQLKKTNLKQMFIVRYADDFRIFCRTYDSAQRILYAVEDFMTNRLHLKLSKDKTRIKNLKKQNMEFLGFRYKLKPKNGKLVCQSHMSNKAIKQSKVKLSEQAKKIKYDTKALIKYNQMIIGIQNYYQIATMINLDMSKIAWDINHIITSKLHRQSKNNGIRRGARLSYTGRRLTEKEKKRYGKSQMLRYDSATGEPIYPLGYIQTRNAMNKTQSETPYTPEGRLKLHQKLNLVNEHLMYQMSTLNGSTEFNDNKRSLFAGQHGKDFITGDMFVTAERIHCHHKLPKYLGGTDEYNNLVLVDVDVHRLIHATDADTINKYLKLLSLTSEQIKKVNTLREIAQLDSI